MHPPGAITNRSAGYQPTINQSISLPRTPDCRSDPRQCTNYAAICNKGTQTSITFATCGTTKLKLHSTALKLRGIALHL